MNLVIKNHGNDPFALFSIWLSEAEKNEPNDPNALILATADADGHPSLRPILLKGHDKNGFVFFTNYESRKGKDLITNPYAEMCFYWKSLSRQVRIFGPVQKTTSQESDDYFATRARRSQIGAHASTQSAPLESPKALNKTLNEIETHYKEIKNIPRPPHWGGFRLIPHRFEFWGAEVNRLHERFAYTRERTDQDNWDATYLNP